MKTHLTFFKNVKKEREKDYQWEKIRTNLCDAIMQKQKNISKETIEKDILLFLNKLDNNILESNEVMIRYKKGFFSNLDSCTNIFDHLILYLSISFVKNKLFMKFIKNHFSLLENQLIFAYSILDESKQKDIVINELYGYSTENSSTLNLHFLNNSFEIIIDSISKYSSNSEMIAKILHYKSIMQNPFLKEQAYAKILGKNHYLSFLLDCSLFHHKKSGKVIYKEFVESFVDGFMQYIDLQYRYKKQDIKDLEKDLNTLVNYNSNNENEQNILEVKQKISVLKTKKIHQKYLPFKELQNRMNFDINRIATLYTTLEKGHRKSIKSNLNTLDTLSKNFLCE